MKAQVLKGSKEQIVERLSRIEGEVREVIVFVDEPGAAHANGHDIFAEMDAIAGRYADFDDSRESAYDSRQDS